MSDFVNSIDVLGDDAVTDSIIDRTISSYADDTVTIIGQNAFMYCTALTSVALPAVTTIQSSAFSYCSALTKVDLAAVTTIKNNTFNYCSNFDTLILRNEETVVTLENKAAFYSTKLYSGNGYIYVPRALIDSYKTASQWSNFANQFRALEDYTVDGTITGELDPTKI